MTNKILGRFLPLLIGIGIAGCTPSLPNVGTPVSIDYCYDGDTCTTSTGEKIRLACIDTPELRGAKADPFYAKAARDHLRSFLQGKSITLTRYTKDRYGRTVGELYANGSNVQQEMVRTGHAKILTRYASQCPWAN
jgi:micrococcal nuclease